MSPVAAASRCKPSNLAPSTLIHTLAGPSVAATQNYANSAISTLIRAVRAILADPPEPTPESLQSLYDLCEGLVGSALPSSSSGSAKSNVAQNLYDRLRIEIERKVGEYATVLRKGESNDGEAWLSQLNTIWKSFNEKMVSRNLCYNVTADTYYQISPTSFLYARYCSI